MFCNVDIGIVLELTTLHFHGIGTKHGPKPVHFSIGYVTKVCIAIAKLNGPRTMGDFVTPLQGTGVPSGLVIDNHLDSLFAVVVAINVGLQGTIGFFRGRFS
jgi:hypothetical protein